jgi:hypothetical protein
MQYDKCKTPENAFFWKATCEIGPSKLAFRLYVKISIFSFNFLLFWVNNFHYTCQKETLVKDIVINNM